MINKYLVAGAITEEILSLLDIFYSLKPENDRIEV